MIESCCLWVSSMKRSDFLHVYRTKGMMNLVAVNGSRYQIECSELF